MVMNEDNGKRAADLETVFSFLGYDNNLGRYGGDNALEGVPLCYWLRCLCGIRKESGTGAAGERPAPEMLYFPLSENKYLIQALLALCCFFGNKRKQHPFNVYGSCSEEWNCNKTTSGYKGCREYLFLEVGQERAVLVDQVRLRHLRLAASRIRSGSLVAVYLTKKSWFAQAPKSAESSLIVTERSGGYGLCLLTVRRILPIPASELLNGLFRLRRVNGLRTLRRKEQHPVLPERLQTMLLPYLYRQGRQARRLPMHRARIVEIM